MYLQDSVKYFSQIYFLPSGCRYLAGYVIRLDNGHQFLPLTFCVQICYTHLQIQILCVEKKSRCFYTFTEKPHFAESGEERSIEHGLGAVWLRGLPLGRTGCTRYRDRLYGRKVPQSKEAQEIVRSKVVPRV